jgi:hypothetical protein
MLRLIQNAEWRPFVELLSPRFFDVVPMRTVLAQARRLGGNYLDATAFSAARAARAKTLAAAGLAVQLVDAPSGPPTPVAPSAVLELYFHQVLVGGTMLLDLRAERFAARATGLEWAPSPAFVALEPRFVEGLRALYFGFYLDDAARFSAGARALGLDAIEGALRAQFGTGDQTRVRFSLPEFQQRFQAVFDACKAAGAQLHPDFIGLGIGLATLYDHLQQSGDTHDVRAAFLRAAERTPSPPA